MWGVKMHKPGSRASLHTVFFSYHWAYMPCTHSGRDSADKVPSHPKSVYYISNTPISLRGLGNLTKSVGKNSIRAVELNIRFSAAHTNLRI